MGRSRFEAGNTGRSGFRVFLLARLHSRCAGMEPSAADGRFAAIHVIQKIVSRLSTISTGAVRSIGDSPDNHHNPQHRTRSAFSSVPSMGAARAARWVGARSFPPGCVRRMAAVLTEGRAPFRCHNGLVRGNRVRGRPRAGRWHRCRCVEPDRVCQESARREVGASDGRCPRGFRGVAGIRAGRLPSFGGRIGCVQEVSFEPLLDVVTKRPPLMNMPLSHGEHHSSWTWYSNWRDSLAMRTVTSPGTMEPR